MPRRSSPPGGIQHQVAEDPLRTLLRTAPVAVAVLDRELRYVYVSNRWCSDYGLPASRVLRRSIYEIFPEIPEDFREIHRRALAGAAVRSKGDIFKLPGKRTARLRWAVHPWGNRKGLPQGIIIITEDITRAAEINQKLRERESMISALFDSASQGILAVDEKGKIRLANRVAEKVFGYRRSELLGQNLEALVPQNLRRLHSRHRRAYLEDPKSRPMGIGLDLAGRRKDGSAFPVEIGLSAVDRAAGKLAVAFVTDVTERDRLNRAVQQREQELQTLLHNIPDAIVRFDRQMRYIYVNEVVTSASGLPPEAFLGKTPGQAGMPKHLVGLWTKSVLGVFRSGRPAVIDFQFPSPKGPTEWEARDIPEFASDGSVESVLCVMREVTERKRLESIAEARHQETRALAARLLTAQEDERRKVSRDLHDGLCQELASLAIDIGEMAAYPPAPPPVRLARLKALQSRAVKASEEARHLAYDLHPAVLDDFGIVIALEALCKELSAKGKFRVTFVRGRLPGAVSREIASCLYRISQEALQNAAKYSRAGSVLVRLDCRAAGITLTIKDNGVGFDLEEVRGRGSLGLIGMEQRARVVGGTLSITSERGRGTRVTVKIPQEEKAV